MKIGFAGLGQMGLPIAANLARGGFDVVAFHRCNRDVTSLEEAGASTTTKLHDLTDADAIFLCLSDTDSVKSVLFGEGGLAPHLKAGQTIVDLSTITYNGTLEISKRLAEGSIDFLDAPISGMEARARDGTLTIMCGGEREIFERIKPAFSVIGSKILLMGPSGSGQLTKLINQLLFDINCAAMAEILPMAAKLRLDSAQVMDVVNSGTGRSYASEFFGPKILEGNFESGYPLKAAYKDLISGAELSASMAIPLPVLAAATSTYQQTLLRGHGDFDKGAMILLFEELLNVEFRRQI
jgi:3-hydroxyisobutyrate dehydrogenase-like beta-hydroxyacid dehydrogenase